MRDPKQVPPIMDKKKDSHPHLSKEEQTPGWYLTATQATQA